MPETITETLPAEALDYIKQANTPTDRTPQINIEAAKTELLAYCNEFITKSKAWRDSSYQTKWEKWQRAADGIYDPALASAKEAWQSKVHVGITASHRESIHAYLFKVMAGTKPPLDMSARYELGEQDQSENIKDIILREMDKARWEVEFDGAMHDSDTYGSGFLRRWWTTETAVRKLKKPIQEQFSDNLNPMGIAGFAKRAMMGQLKTVGFQEDDVEVITYRGLKLQKVSIWDVYKTPKALKIPGTTIAWKYPLTYGEVVKGARDGYYFPEAVDKLKGITANPKFSTGENTVNSNREVLDQNVTKTPHGMELEIYELFGKMPTKWIYTILGKQFQGDGEDLVSARVIFHESCPIAVEMNDEYDGEPPLHEIKYFPKNGDSYGMGVPEMLEAPQAVINEIVNQRLDAGSQALNHHFGVIEKALVNPKEDLKSKASTVLRLDAKYCPNGDARAAIAELPISDIPVRAGFAEVNEWERFAQERTSSNRIMQGSTGTGKDGTKTLGEQQMLMESAGAKFSYVGLMMELSGMLDLFHGIWKTVYKNIDPTDIEDAIGPERAQSFIMITPEEVQRDYIYKPLGVFTAENKLVKQARIGQMRREFIGAPWLDDEKIYDGYCRAGDIDGDLFKKTEQQILQDQANQIPIVPDGQPMAEQPQADTTGQPMPQGVQVQDYPQPGQTGGNSGPSPDEIKAAYKSGQISREMAVSMLKERHGFV